MAVVEVVELLGELEGVAREIRRLRCGNGLLNQQAQASGEQPRLPQAGPIFGRERGQIEPGYGGERSLLGDAGLAEDVGGADDPVLDVRSGLAFEGGRVFEGDTGHYVQYAI